MGNCGQVGKEFYIEDSGGGVIVSKDFLERLVDNIVKRSVSYYETTRDYAFRHRERSMHSVVCPSIADITHTFLMEYPLKRKPSGGEQQGGFVDYLISYRKCTFFMEFKHSFFAYRNAKNPRKNIITRFQSALDQLRSIRKNEYWGLGRKDQWVDKLAFEAIVFYKGSKNKIYMSDLRGESFKSSFSELMKNKEWNSLKPNLQALWILNKRLVKPVEFSNGYEIYPAVAFVGKVIL